MAGASLPAARDPASARRMPLPGARTQPRVVVARDPLARDPAVAKKFTLLQTPRLVLRPIALADWPAIYRYMSDPVVTRWLPEGLLDETQTQAFARKNAGRSARAIAVIEA